jgi:hypothetical protein
MEKAIEKLLHYIRVLDKTPISNFFKDTRNPMAKSLDTKKKEALSVAVRMGHSLNEFRDFAFFPAKSRTCCKTCGRVAFVDVSSPSECGFSMGGPALIDRCRVK